MISFLPLGICIKKREGAQELCLDLDTGWDEILMDDQDCNSTTCIQYLWFFFFSELFFTVNRNYVTSNHEKYYHCVWKKPDTRVYLIKAVVSLISLTAVDVFINEHPYSTPHLAQQVSSLCFQRTGANLPAKNLLSWLLAPE